MKYLFGPVNSRRLGISLGIDLVPFKTCTLDCVYCECGRTTNLTSEIIEYVPTGEVIEELLEFLSAKPALDVLTFSGSGEPTLHSGIGTIIEFLKGEFPEYNISVLTNGTLLWKDSVRKSLLRADMIIPSLDAVSEDVFKKISRPVQGVRADRVLEGLAALKREFNGEIILEVFIVPDLNDTDAELKRLKESFLSIQPDKIQLNNLDRPGAEDWVKHAAVEKLNYIVKYFQPYPVEIIGEPHRRDGSRRDDDLVKSVLSTIGRRPSTIDDLSVALGVRIAESSKVISHLLAVGRIEEKTLDRGHFYLLKRGED